MFKVLKYFVQFSFAYFPSDNCKIDVLREYIQKLNDELCIVLGNVFNCNRFASELLINHQHDHIRVCLEVMRFLLQTPTLDNSHYLHHEDDDQKNIMHHMLNVCICKGKYYRNVFHSEAICIFILFLISEQNRKSTIAYIAKFAQRYGICVHSNLVEKW